MARSQWERSLPARRGLKVRTSSTFSRLPPTVHSKTACSTFPRTNSSKCRYMYSTTPWILHVVPPSKPLSIVLADEPAKNLVLPVDDAAANDGRDSRPSEGSPIEG